MYTCVECGSSFDEPKVICDRHGLDNPPFETYMGCPDCGGAFIDSIICTVCERVITDEYIHVVDGQNICENCYTTCHIYE